MGTRKACLRRTWQRPKNSALCADGRGKPRPYEDKSKRHRGKGPTLTKRAWGTRKSNTVATKANDTEAKAPRSQNEHGAPAKATPSLQKQTTQRQKPHAHKTSMGHPQKQRRRYKSKRHRGKSPTLTKRAWGTRKSNTVATKRSEEHTS